MRRQVCCTDGPLALRCSSPVWPLILKLAMDRNILEIVYIKNRCEKIGYTDPSSSRKRHIGSQRRQNVQRTSAYQMFRFTTSVVLLSGIGEPRRAANTANTANKAANKAGCRKSAFEKTKRFQNRAFNRNLTTQKYRFTCAQKRCASVCLFASTSWNAADPAVCTNRDFERNMIAEVSVRTSDGNRVCGLGPPLTVSAWRTAGQCPAACFWCLRQPAHPVVAKLGSKFCTAGYLRCSPQQPRTTLRGLHLRAACSPASRGRPRSTKNVSCVKYGYKCN